MNLKGLLRRPSLAIFLGLCVAALFCEVMRMKTETAAIQSHQARWDCWAQESSKVARCRDLWKPGLEDANYCDEAISACKVNGSDGRVDKASARADLWRVITAWFRLALLVATVGFIAWWAIVRPARRMLRRTMR